MAVPSSTTNPGWRPGPISTGNPLLDANLDTALKAAFDNIYGLQQQSVQSTVPNSALASGVATVTGAQKGIATGLATVSNVVATLDGIAAVFEIVTTQPTPNAAGLIDIAVWKATATGNVTPIASTTARKVRWLAFGTPVSQAAP